MATVQSNDRALQPTDVFSWYLERDPLLRVPVVVVVHLDAEPDVDVLRSRLRDALSTVPLMSDVVVEPPFRLAPPRWAHVDDVDLDWHVSEVAAPSPGDDAAVLDLARHEATTPFDTRRPLWNLTVVHELTGGRAALLLRFHHALTDGVGGVALAAQLFDLERRPAQQSAAPPPLAPGHPHPVVDALVDEARTQVRRAVLGPGALAAQGVHALAHPRDTVATLASVARTVAPVRRTLSPLLRSRGLSRSLHVLEVPFEQMHRVANAQGATVNDAFLTAIARGLRRHHNKHGLPLPSIRVTMPINLRAPDDPPAGNRITLLRFLVPTGDEDVGRNVREVRETAQLIRHERSLPHTQAIARALSLLPSGFVGSMLKHVEAVVSDVPGPPVPLYAAGALVTGLHVFGPTTGAALNATLLSYEGTCFVGLNIDTRAVAQPEELASCVREAFDELLSWDGAPS